MIHHSPSRVHAMKTKILLALLFIVFVSSCNETTEQIAIRTRRSTVIATSLAEEPFLNELLSSAGFESNARDKYARTNSEGVSVQVDEILKVLQDDSSHYTYTFALQNHSIGFSNLILEETPDGNYLAFILRYEFEGAFDLLNYSGRILRLDLDGTTLGELTFQDGELVTGSNGHAKAMQGSTCLTGATKHEECMEWGTYKNALGTQETCLRKALVITLKYGDCSSYTPAQPDEPVSTFGGGTTISGSGNGSSGSTQPADIDSGTGIKPIPGYKPVKPVVVIPERWDESIDDSGLKPCMKTIMADLKNLKNGSIGQIIQKFSGDAPGYNWQVKDGALAGNENAFTGPGYNKLTNNITTTFDASKFAEASDISIARTIIHESIHAYLVTFFSRDPLASTKSYAQLVEDYLYYKDANVAHHSYMAKNLVSEIAKSLEEFGKNKGYTLPSQFYNDLAWGGLTHTGQSDNNGFWMLTIWFQNAYPDPLTRSRIIETIAVEQSGRDMDGVKQIQSGSKSNCN